MVVEYRDVKAVLWLFSHFYGLDKLISTFRIPMCCMSGLFYIVKLFSGDQSFQFLFTTDRWSSLKTIGLLQFCN
jgi:hypothetical protein